MPTTPALITLASIQQWLSGDPNTQFPQSGNDMTVRMIASVSAFATAYLQGPIAPTVFSETYNGKGGVRLPLRNTPIISVASLVVNTVSITARPAAGQFGFVADQTELYIDQGWGGPVVGYGANYFRHGIQNIQVTYTAGYQTTAALSVPSAAPYTLDSDDLSQMWNSDGGVAYTSSGAAFVAVTSAPTLAGTYQLTLDSLGNATYLFSSADAGAAVTVTYGYTPGDVAQALIELLGERIRTRDRIGQTSKNFGQTSTSFSQRDMNAAAELMLQPYKRTWMVSP